METRPFKFTDLPENEQAIIWASICYREQMRELGNKSKLKPDPKTPWKSQMDQVFFDASYNRMVVNEIQDWTKMTTGIDLTSAQIVETLESMHEKKLCYLFPPRTPEQEKEISELKVVDQAGNEIDLGPKTPRDAASMRCADIRFFCIFPPMPMSLEEKLGIKTPPSEQSL